MRPTSPRRLTLPLLLLALAAAAACTRTPIVAPPITEAPLPAPEPRPYQLQPGDLLEVKFWGAPELDQEVRIRPDGAISLPFVDEVAAAGLSPAELDDELTERYARELALPEITVIVREALGYLVWIGGEVGNEGPVAFDRPLTLIQAIHSAGGLLDSARRKEILLIRTLPTGERAARSIDLRPVLSGGAPGMDVVLAPSDVVYVPATKIANVNRFIDEYVNGILPIRPVVTVPLFEDPLLGDAEEDN